jgi:hypothetical protein
VFVASIVDDILNGRDAQVGRVIALVIYRGELLSVVLIGTSE